MAGSVEYDGKKFQKVPIKIIVPDTPLPVPLFVALPNKAIEYIKIGQPFPAEQYNRFLLKKVHFLLCLENNLTELIQWLKDQREKVIEKDAQKVGGQYRPICELNQDLREKIFETFSEEELEPHHLDEIRSQVNELIETLMKDPRAAFALAKISRYDEGMINHSVNVANFSVFLGLVLGHNHPLVLQNLYLGGLYHDYGKTKVAASHWNKGGANLYSQALQVHPDNGAALIRKSGKFPDQVCTIVAQHHEAFGGGGFPTGLKGKEIYELSRIVAIANVFDNIVCEHRARPIKERLSQAKKILQYDRGKQFDPLLVERVIEAIDQLDQEELVETASISLTQTKEEE